jgi:ribosome maturation factor RimP
MEGNENVPFFYLIMQTEGQIQTIEREILNLIQEHPSHFLVETRIKPTNNIKVFLDADEGMPLSELIQYNRKLYRWIEETGLYPDGNFSLEVSSPGLDEPLKLQRQYQKNMGRFVEIMLNDNTTKEGKLLEATEDGLVIEIEEGKARPAGFKSKGENKKSTKQELILLTDIKTTKIQIKF